MIAMLHTALGALFFAGAGYLGALLGSAYALRLTRFDDGPEPHAVPLAALIAGCGAVGAFVTLYAVSQTQTLLFALVCLALVAVWITDARCGIIPDVFTLGPLAVTLLVALVQHEWSPFISAAIPFFPFAAMAAVSRGRGIGWGDVKLVALGGAVLGAPLAILALTLACLAAAVINFARGRRRGIIAFAPYLASAIGAALPLGILR